jgi:hypothetical protein
MPCDLKHNIPAISDFVFEEGAEIAANWLC